jgi:hypothetical protein
MNQKKINLIIKKLPSEFSEEEKKTAAYLLVQLAEIFLEMKEGE